MTGSPGSRLTEHPDPGRLKLAEDAAAAANYRRVGGRYLITNDLGFHSQLTPKDFEDYLGGNVEAGSPLWAELQAKGFIRSHMDFPCLIEDYRRKNSFLFAATPLHILVTTLRCNHKCLYCHSSVVGMQETDKDMSLETAQKAVDLIFQSPAQSVNIEFQGGEPMVNWPVIHFVTRYAKLKNRRAGRNLCISLVTNLSLMDEEKFDFLNRERVTLCTSLDGPAGLHDKNRVFTGGPSHELTTRWLRRFLDLGPGPDGKKPFKPGALLTTTRFTLDHPKEIVDEYLRVGLPGIFLRPLTPIGFARRTWDKIGYTPEDFLAFYRKALDYILELNLRGVPFFERMARTLLVKILLRTDPNYVDLRSPSGAALGVLAYDYSGDVYTGDEARMLAQEGKTAFRIGNVSSRYNEIIGHPLVKAAAVATLLDNQPFCSHCSYKPYCGQDPAYNLQTQQTLWGHTPASQRCEIFMGLFDAIFERLQDERCRKIFESWVS